MKKCLCLVLWIVLMESGFAQTNLLQSGPMVGYTRPGMTSLWVQTKSEAKVKIKYFEVTCPEKKFFTTEYSTLKAEAFTAHLVADRTYPGKKYQYELYINNVLVPRPYALEFKTSSVNDEPEDFK